MIRLADLDPRAVAEEVVGLVLNHAVRLLGHPPVDLSQSIGLLDLRVSVVTLTRYAQQGGELDAAPSDYVQSVVEALYTAAHPDVYSSVEGDWQRSEEPRHAVDVVIRAALAREIVDSGVGTVPVAHLAALASLSYQAARRCVMSGELQADDGSVRVPVARRWLVAREVPGVFARR